MYSLDREHLPADRSWLQHIFHDLLPHQSELFLVHLKEFVKTIIFSLSPLRTSFGLCLSWTLLSTSSPSRSPLSPYTWIEHG